MKKVLLLGDSIRINYQDLVKQKLEGRAEVVSPESNCAFAKYTLCCLGGWLRELGTPDIVHWNNGIWDACIRFEEDGPFTPIDEYLDALRRILRELRKTGAQVIFATSTPPRDEHDNQNRNRIAWYNHEAVRLMKQEGVPVDDLFAVVDADREGLICDDYCHLNDAGKQACSDAVVKCIEQYL